VPVAYSRKPMSADAHSPGTRDPQRGLGVRTLLPLVVIVVIVGGVTLLLTGGSSKPTLPGNASTAKSASFQGALLEPPTPAPELSTLRNYDGTNFNLSSERGKAVFVTFLYAHCPDVCPLIASNLHNAYAQMSPTMRRQVAIVAVSVDPHGDTPGTVGAFVKQHELTGEAKYLIGSPHQDARVWEAWKVGSERDTSDPTKVNHSALIYGIGANGKLYTIYAANFQPAQIIHDVTPLLTRTS
jgi:protein SCO1